MQFFTLDSARTMYGMVNTANFADGLYTVKNTSCRFCGQPAAMHVLHSTLNDSMGATGSFALANQLFAKLKELLAKNPKTKSAFKSPKEKMIGVLKVKSSSTIYASHSGQFENDELFSLACEQLKMKYSPRVTANTIQNRAGGLVNSQFIQAFDYQCAAPRIIQHAISEGAFPMEMTEICFAGPTPGRVAGSCGRCRSTIPAMLCPTTPDVDRLRQMHPSKFEPLPGSKKF